MKTNKNQSKQHTQKYKPYTKQHTKTRIHTQNTIKAAQTKYSTTQRSEAYEGRASDMPDNVCRVADFNPTSEAETRRGAPGSGAPVISIVSSNMFYWFD